MGTNSKLLAFLKRRPENTEQIRAKLDELIERGKAEKFSIEQRRKHEGQKDLNVQTLIEDYEVADLNSGVREILKNRIIEHYRKRAKATDDPLVILGLCENHDLVRSDWFMLERALKLTPTNNKRVLRQIIRASKIGQEVRRMAIEKYADGATWEALELLYDMIEHQEDTEELRYILYLMSRHPDNQR
jgi:hypothetical protein